jgi:hypothetical protein
MMTKPLWACAVALLVVIGGVAPAVLAEEPIQARHDFVEENLPTSSSLVDVWKLVCPTGTAKASADVQNLSTQSGVLFTVLVVKYNTGKTMLRHDAKGGSYSSPAILSGGSGTYYIQIHKNITTSAPALYDSVQLCLDSANPPNVLPHISHALIQDN